MQNSNLIRTAKGVLTLMVLAVAPATSAWAMQPQPTSVVQEAAQPQQNPPQQDQSKAKQQALVVTGTIIKNGSDFVLKDDKGTVYRLDAQDKVAQFENKSVKVTGKLEQPDNANQIAMLHVDAIEAMAA